MKKISRIGGDAPAAAVAGTEAVAATAKKGAIVISVGLPVLQNDPLQRVPHILAPVQRLLDVVVQLLPLDHLQRLGAAVEQAAHGGVVVVVAFAFLVVNL